MGINNGIQQPPYLIPGLPTAMGNNELVGTDAAGNLVATLAGKGPAFRAYLSANQTGLTLGAYDKIKLDTVSGLPYGFDTAGYFDLTNFRYKPLIAGYYQINASIYAAGGTGNITAMQTALFWDEQRIAVSNVQAVTTIYAGGGVSDVIYFNGVSDYVDLRVNLSASTTPSILGTAFVTWMSGVLVRAV